MVIRSVGVMTSTLAPPRAGPAAVVEAARNEVLSLREELWAAKPAATLLDTFQQLEALRSTLDAVQLAVIREIDATDAAKTEQWSSTRDYITAVAGGTKGTGPAAVKLAAALESDCTRTAEELADARISRKQAEVITRAITTLPVKASLRARAERRLLHEARSLDATDLATAAEHLIEILDPEGHERREERKLRRLERAAHLNRFLSITEDGAGGVRIKGRTTVEDAAVIKTALWPLAAPAPTTPGACGGADDCPVTGCAHDGRDPRDHGARFLDALVEGCQRLLDTDVLPECHGAKPRLTLTMDLADLVAGLGVALLDTGDRLPASVVRQLACDAEVIPTVLGTHSEVLDLGRLRRLVSTALWNALVTRDWHCAFPGCRRPPIACDAHHIVHWADGGGTDLDNLVLLCRAHHTVIHTTGWEVRLNPLDRRPEFIPPSTLDPERQPVRERQPRE